MDFDQLIQQIKFDKDMQEVVLSVPSDWAQGRTVYGGLSAALLYHSMVLKADTARPARYLNCSFVSPVATDVPLQITVELLRSGRSATQLSARLTQEDRTCVLAQLCLGESRESKIRVEPTTAHAMKPPQKASFLPQIPKVVPRFLRHYELKVEDGRLPFTGGKKSHMHGWMRFKKPPEQLTRAHLISLIDAWPCPVLQQLRWPAPASSMNWNIEFIYPHQTIAPGDWLAYQSVTRQAGEGYCHMESDVWNAQGELLAISRQVVAVFG